MTEDETERRLRAALRNRAAQVDSDLSGPELRRRAAQNRPDADGRVRRLAPALAAAAAVAVIATVAAVIGSNDGGGPRPVQPGGSVTAPATTPSTPATPPTTLPSPASSVPSSTPAATPSGPPASASPGGTAPTRRSTLSVPSVSSTPGETGAPSAPARRSLSGSTTGR